MAVDMFLKIEGKDVKGESQDDAKNFKDTIDILAWSWGASQSGTTHMGAGGGGGKSNFQDVSITKYIDAASEDLLGAVAQGTRFDKATLSVRKAGGTPLVYVKIEMENVMVTSYSTGGSGGEDRLTENVTLNFSIFNFVYVPQKEDGSKDTKQEFGWDIAENKKA